MQADKSQILNEKGLLFLGVITASLSHELNNSLTVINEFNGLLLDLLIDFDKGVAIDCKKLARATKKIEAQIERGKELIKRLNRFAHSLDEPVTIIDVNELMQSIMELSKRLAENKELNLEYNMISSPLKFCTNPFHLQHAIFSCFELFMLNPDENRTISLSAEKNVDGIKIEITGNKIGSGETAGSRMQILDILLESLNGSYEVSSKNNKSQSIILSLKELKVE